jgi:Na+-transporting methylmalonyl-CoA/oxaloacetate decarboxylase gamma subunit
LARPAIEAARRLFMIVEALETMLFGMLGIFIVMALIICTIHFLGKIKFKSDNDG